ncbi:MAG TPA: 4-alpha-glucanotransferase [Mycobacteriales bacterium]|nr:4-alpha-glucanotransferase [Mycobacteriales bacterium]
MHPDGSLRRLAAAHGVMTEYENWAHEPVEVSTATVVATLRALGVDASRPAAVSDALSAAELAPWRRAVSPTVVVTPTRRTAEVNVREGAPVAVRIALEDGGDRELAVGPASATRDVDGTTVARHTVEVPPDLPLGYHTLVSDDGEGEHHAALVCAPDTCPTRAELGRVWGWTVQLYAARSRDSWGLGDYADLAALAGWSGGTGADFVLCNPLHAAAPTLPQVDSPYSPVSRRFHSAAYLRVPDVPEVARLDAAGRARLARLAEAGAAANRSDRIERDPIARMQREALELVWAASRTAERQAELAAFAERGGRALQDFAVWCALAEQNGSDWRSWPVELRHPRSPAVDRARADLADTVDFHVWLQWLCDEQLAAAQRAALDGGQRIGVIHDLAVGATPGGADAWALQDDIALGVSVGAPPDSFNQRGQDWALPPLRPDRLVENAFAPFRDMLRAVLRHSGGVRIDHAMGLFRLYWIPEGCPPAEGTYVRYPASDLLAVLALEATRAGALVVAEDLGTVEDGVPEALSSYGVHGSAVLWFERSEDDGTFNAGADYRPDVLASVTTHDLPTAAGFWTGEATRVRAELGQLGAGRTVAEQEADDEEERRALVVRLEAEGLVAPGAGDEELVTAMHLLLARSPARLLGVALPDALGEVRQPNLPGTQDEYPNWRLPLADATGDEPRPILLDEVVAHPAVRRLVELLRAERPRSG